LGRDGGKKGAEVKEGWEDGTGRRKRWSEGKVEVHKGVGKGKI